MQQMMRSLPSRTCAKIAPRPAVEASVYRRKVWLKSGKAVIGLVVSSVLRRSKAAWQSSLQWKTASFGAKAYKGAAMAEKLDPRRSGLRWPFWEEGSPEWLPGARSQAVSLLQ